MGNSNCCAQTAPDVDAWKTDERVRTMSREEARALMPLYDYESSLSLDHEERTSSAGDAMSIGLFPDTPLSVSSSHGFGDRAMVLVSDEGVVQVQDDLEEEKTLPPAEDEELELSLEARALLPAPNSCPRSGINLRAQSPSAGNGPVARAARREDAGAARARRGPGLPPPHRVALPAPIPSGLKCLHPPAVMARERTYIMVKPDGVQRHLVGEIIKRFETKGYKLVALKLARPSVEHPTRQQRVAVRGPGRPAWTEVDGAHGGSTSVCRTSAALLGSVGTLNAEGIRSLGLIFACFLTVYGLMRASVMGVQGSQSRSYRLKRIKKSTSEVVAPAVSVSTGQGVTMMPRRSSTSTSSSSPSIEVDPSQRDSMFDAAPSNTAALSGALTRAHSSTDAMQTPLPATFRPMSRSIGAIEEKATSCQHCGKRFGLFRKRYMCDICHSVSLCRKCGYQASVDSFANARTGMQMNSVGSSRNAGGRGMGRRRSSLSQQQQKKLKIRTICRNCCDDMYRYSTHASPQVYDHRELTGRSSKYEVMAAGIAQPVRGPPRHGMTIDEQHQLGGRIARTIDSGCSAMFRHSSRLLDKTSDPLRAQDLHNNTSIANAVKEFLSTFLAMVVLAANGGS
ncbi:hypothetical protein ON010_g1875 [Phytophthora cinnamomi]|nr:hypothetical protein ON010_g1875 [Phytophthora cinnamomi]